MSKKLQQAIELLEEALDCADTYDCVSVSAGYQPEYTELRIKIREFFKENGKVI